ncbi:VC0807 family protein, partial [Pradoshia sp.]
WDLICYLIFPLVIWNVLNDRIDEYYAMLISTVPGIIYSIVRFIEYKRVNFFGLFMIGTLMIRTLVDVLSGSALQMMWNNVFYSIALAVFFLVTNFINKPTSLLFALDLTEMQGYDRKALRKRFYQPKILFVFKLITYGFAFRSLLLASINVWLINQYGVDAYTKALVTKQIIGIGIMVICMYGFFHISKMLMKQQEPNTITPD